jgi:ATP-dependent DNA helicase RecG
VDLIGDRTGRIIPIYPQSEKVRLSTWDIARFVEEALRRCDARGIADPVPSEIVDRLGLIDRHRAIVQIHAPESMDDVARARARLVFDELLRVQLQLVLRKRALEAQERGLVHDTDGELVNRFRERLPFPLTAAQQRVIDEIEGDLAGPHPMHRLLQGDVGAGKTVVAVSALLVGVEGHHQGALMAPTEVLAEQHAAGVRALLDGFEVPDERVLGGMRPLNVALLTNRITGSERKRVLGGLADGSVDIAIGTHALIQDAVDFHSLGVVVIDEQHRFGVDQRSALRDKTAGADGIGHVPDVLVMTATPIPRTAAMTIYGDLDVSVLDEMPPGRTPIVTHLVAGPLEEAAMWAHVRAEVAEGRQAYVVCPLVEESEKLEVASAEETFERLAADDLTGLRLGLLHGRMKSDHKDEVMGAFRRGDLDALVATTVIEVGVDVPNATVMVVLDADRFGIAQLHQLRGRVGRGRHASTCWLVSLPKEGAEQPAGPNPRLDALVATTDGFELAEVDLDLRGEGTIMAAAQSGRNDLKLASLRRDRDVVEVAREVAFAMVDHDLLTDELRDELSLSFSDADADYLLRS